MYNVRPHHCITNIAYLYVQLCFIFFWPKWMVDIRLFAHYEPSVEGMYMEPSVEGRM